MEDNDYEPVDEDWSVKYGPLLIYGGAGALAALILLGGVAFLTSKR